MGCISTIITDGRRRTAVKHRPSRKAPVATPAVSDECKSSSAPADETPRPQQGWPPWLAAVVGDAIREFVPRCADTFQKLDKIGEGTYSNVYKARDLVTGKTVALKKVRFDNLEAESIKFMAREILVLTRLDHPNVIKLEGLVTSRLSSGLYLAFEYMEHDLSGIAARQNGKFTEPQVKCYMRQLLSGLEHCHNRDVLHRDIKCSNLLIDNEGTLKIADFGLATFYDPEREQVMTNKVVTLWYRAPELLLGATSYGIGIDLWSAGCILAELLYGKPIMPGRTEVEQLHKIFKLCGSPSEAYWNKFKLPNANIFKPPQPYTRCITETFKDFPPSALPLLETLLSMDPDERGTATTALNSEFFAAEPHACEPSSLPKYPPSKEMDLKLIKEKARRDSSKRPGAFHGSRMDGVHGRAGRLIPAPEATAENQATLHRLRVMKKANPMSRSGKFPPAHQDGVVGSSANACLTGPVSSAAPDSRRCQSLNQNSSSSVGNALAGSSTSQKTLKATPKLLQMGSSSSHSCHRMLVYGSNLTIRSK
ncbi:probable serine/threonine-protein kinase At1g54610 isoform X1 [Rhodamnia argentea]|uniref:Probable serine/threonine-protein kinase At1g54610 isoform X1 n=1 Tax=Rhodamnia argentea TaxID=178133 RepID=A0A8B8Q5H5_9MYRT|nr:probable serine/threonine-protein kinase At1g54610 isoform X1 [Rhodamnia argentea]